MEPLFCEACVSYVKSQNAKISQSLHRPMHHSRVPSCAELYVQALLCSCSTLGREQCSGLHRSLQLVSKFWLLARLIALYAMPCNEAGLLPDVSWWHKARMPPTLHCTPGLKVTPCTLHPCTGTRAVPFRKDAMNYFTEAHWHSHIKKQYTGATNNIMINSTVCVSRSRTLAASYYNRNVDSLQFRIQPFTFNLIKKFKK